MTNTFTKEQLERILARVRDIKPTDDSNAVALILDIALQERVVLRPWVFQQDLGGAVRAMQNKLIESRSLAPIPQDGKAAMEYLDKTCATMLLAALSKLGFSVRIMVEQ